MARGVPAFGHLADGSRRIGDNRHGRHARRPLTGLGAAIAFLFGEALVDWYSNTVFGTV